MLEDMARIAEEEIGSILVEMGFPKRRVPFRKIPFSGAWGLATSVCFELAKAAVKQDEAARNLSKKELKAMTERKAAEVAAETAKRLSGHPDFSRVEAVRGYVNLYFHADRVASSIVRDVLSRRKAYGSGKRNGDRVMVEYSQPNTHKAFHIGHLRNVCLGHSLAEILRFAGYQVITANYIGDMGNHVIKCLWCYMKFHAGEEPASNRGIWLGEIYAEADRRISESEELRESIVRALTTVRERTEIDDAIRGKLYEGIVRHLKSKLGAPSEDDAARNDLEYLIDCLERNQEVSLVRLNEPSLILEIWSEYGDKLTEMEGEAGESAANSHQASLGKLRSEWEAVNERVSIWPYPDEIRELHRRWEEKDPELISLWERTRQWSMEEFRGIYDELGVDFDVWFYESQEERKGKEIVGEMMEAGLGELSEGLPAIDIDRKLGLQNKKYGVVPLLRSDGTSLYLTKDLALARKKFQEYGIDRSIYVVAAPQSLYFQQLFKILELWGFPQARNCYHLSYEIVTLEEGMMASRTGNVILYRDLAGGVFKRAREIIEEKNPTLSPDDKERISRLVALGAMKFSMLNTGNNKVIVFNWNTALDFDGCTAPYIQYAHARACRILEKAGYTPQEASFKALAPEELNLLEKIAEFPDAVNRAADRYSPMIITTYAYELAQHFADFYEKHQVIRAEDESTRRGRLALVDCTRQTLKNALSLLGIEAPTHM